MFSAKLFFLAFFTFFFEFSLIPKPYLFQNSLFSKFTLFLFRLFYVDSFLFVLLLLLNIYIVFYLSFSETFFTLFLPFFLSLLLLPI